MFFDFKHCFWLWAFRFESTHWHRLNLQNWILRKSGETAVSVRIGAIEVCNMKDSCKRCLARKDLFKIKWMFVSRFLHALRIKLNQQPSSTAHTVWLNRTQSKIVTHCRLVIPKWVKSVIYRVWSTTARDTFWDSSKCVRADSMRYQLKCAR